LLLPPEERLTTKSTFLFTAHSLRSLEPQRALSFYSFFLSAERAERKKQHPCKDGIYTYFYKFFLEENLVPPGQSGQKQHMVFNIVDIFIRIPLSGILIKNSFSAFFASLR